MLGTYIKTFLEAVLEKQVLVLIGSFPYFIHLFCNMTKVATHLWYIYYCAFQTS